MKAREVFEQFPDVEWIVNGLYGVSLIKTEPYPDVDRGYWTFSVLLSDIIEEIDEFSNKPWTDCKISRAEAMQDDCCEWKVTERDGWTFSVDASCGSHFSELKKCDWDNYKYCPGCGKLIKEVTK